MSRSSRKSVADILWSAMKVNPAFSSGNAGPVRLWREAAYPWLVRREFSSVQSHRSPEPWRSVNFALEKLAGNGEQRHWGDVRGVEGGRLTEQEYRLLVDGACRAPLVIVGGLPRSGTTSIQSLVRALYPTRVPEIPSNERRYSLWDFPKHDVSTMMRLAACSPEDVRVIVPVRRFEDAVASLCVGRGGLERVDLERKLTTWFDWVRVARMESVVPIPFEALSARSPRAIGDDLQDRLGIVADAEISEFATFSSLMSDSGRGDISTTWQSNLPNAERKPALSEARDVIIARIGRDRIDAAADVYQELVQSEMDAFGTVEPA